MLEKDKLLLPLEILKHPVDGFYVMRQRKLASYMVSFIILLFWLLASVLEYQSTGFRFNYNDVERFNVFFLIARTWLVFVLWVASNWAFNVFLGGEGTLRQICSVSAYALLPFILATFTAVILSNMLSLEEILFIKWITWIGLGWSAILMMSGLKVIHDFSMQRLVLSIIMTIVGILLVLFLLILCFSLFQQIYVFIRTVINEVTYRITFG